MEEDNGIVDISRKLKSALGGIEITELALAQLHNLPLKSALGGIEIQKDLTEAPCRVNFKISLGGIEIFFRLAAGN